MGTLYDELGVRADASAGELRQAYRRQARRLHPDLHPGADGSAAEAMTRLNSAWTVLSDPDERRRYDLELALAAAQRRAARMVDEGSWRVAPSSVPEPVAHPAPRMRARLWVLIVVILLAIFIFTAYAADRPPITPKPGQTGQCLTSNPNLETYVPCTQPNLGRLQTEVSTDQPCPPGSFRHLLTSRNRVACLIREK